VHAEDATRLAVPEPGADDGTHRAQEEQEVDRALDLKRFLRCGVLLSRDAVLSTPLPEIAEDVHDEYHRRAHEDVLPQPQRPEREHRARNRETAAGRRGASAHRRRWRRGK